MFKNFLVLLLVLPMAVFAQFTITGRVVNHADKKPVPDASIFLGNTSVGGKTSSDGTFTLRNAKPGKYNLIVSVVGYETYSQTIVVDNADITLAADIEITPKEISLHEVSITAKRTHDTYRDRNYGWFKREFLGSSYLAANCKILNPQVLELSYDDDTHTLTGSSYDFLEIENDALGYKIKYLLTNFTMDDTDVGAIRVHYEGSALFEKMNGTPGQLKRWQNARQEVYEGSEMHFLRSALANRIEEEGFRVLEVTAKRGASRKRDGLSYQNLGNTLLTKKDIINLTTQGGLYALKPPTNALHITYNKKHHFGGSSLFDLGSTYNNDVTVLNFTAAYALFDKNGGMADPNSVSFYGAWGRNRIAELLPIDYEQQQNQDQKKDSIEVLSTRLKNFLEVHITEKAYLHFDKPYYAAGDTIYFKTYVTLGEQHQLSDLSGVLHVDLINTVNKIDQSIKLQINGGIGWGDFALPDSLPKGNYRLRAYTQWMRNDGNYFERKIPVGSVHTDKIPESRTAKAQPAGAKPDLQFFPEGGSLIAGLHTKIAFKAVGRDGLGVDFKGIVTDNSGKTVTEFSSTHLGMGYFYLQSEEGKTYSADITYADGSRDKINLPSPAGGITLAVNNDSIPNSNVKIWANATYFKEHKGEDFTLLIYSGGVAVTVDCKLDSAEIALDIIKRRLHTGVARLTLFSPSGEPLSERLVFIQRFDHLDLALNSDKTAYLRREKATIHINAKNRADEPAKGHFSISIVDENKVPADDNAENTILTDLLLTSDLKGYIEQPNYYFNNITTKTQADLDLVMLTHGYRKFDWKPLLNNSYSPVAWQPEKGLEISGTAKSVFGRPLNKGTISLIAKRGAGFATATTDDKGRFRFTGLSFPDTAKFILQAVNAKGSDNTKLVFDKDTPAPDVIPALIVKNNDVNQSISSYLNNSKLQQDEIAKYGILNGRMLKTVNIKDKKMKSRPISITHPIGPEAVNQEIHGDELQKAPGISLLDKVLSKFYGRARTPALIIVDGVAGIDAGGIIASDVESVEAVYDANAAFYGMRAAGGLKGFGVWIIETKKGKGKDSKDIASIGILPISPVGFYKAREFYAPKYDYSELKNNRPDLRSTIFWQPELITDKNGNASLEYYNADGSGTYRVTIEGIDDKGNLGRSVYRYQVK